jgi:hypothetical protein
MTREGMNLIERYVLDWHDTVPYFQWEPGQPLRIEWAFEVVNRLRLKSWRLYRLCQFETRRDWQATFAPLRSGEFSEHDIAPEAADAIFAAALKVAQRIAEGK